jgi:hypothetical protein
MNEWAAANPPLRIRGVRGVTNEHAAYNSPLKVRGVRGVMNEQDVTSAKAGVQEER